MEVAFEFFSDPMYLCEIGSAESVEIKFQEIVEDENYEVTINTVGGGGFPFANGLTLKKSLEFLKSQVFKPTSQVKQKSTLLPSEHGMSHIYILLYICTCICIFAQLYAYQLQ